jgi:hypothetical protein
MSCWWGRILLMTCQKMKNGQQLLKYNILIILDVIYQYKIFEYFEADGTIFIFDVVSDSREGFNRTIVSIGDF